MTPKKFVVLSVVIAGLVLAAVAPAFAQEGNECPAFVPEGDQIAVTGVIEYAAFGAGGVPVGPACGNGTPAYALNDESTQLGYVLYGEYLEGYTAPTWASGSPSIALPGTAPRRGACT